jgi:hypothetical protein
MFSLSFSSRPSSSSTFVSSATSIIICLLLLLFVIFEFPQHDGVESGLQKIVSNRQRSIFSFTTVVVDATTNTNDSIAMKAFRSALTSASFSSNWNSTEDPCGPPGKMISEKVVNHCIARKGKDFTGSSVICDHISFEQYGLD